MTSCDETDGDYGGRVSWLSRASGGGNDVSCDASFRAGRLELKDMMAIRFALAAAFFTLLGACAPAGTGAARDGMDGSAPFHGPDKDASAADIAPVPPDAAGHCPAGRKLCSGACASPDDPAFGCSAMACAPCQGTANGSATCSAQHCSIACNAGYRACGGKCVSTTDVTSCDASCTPCAPPPADATATCNGTACDFACNAGFKRVAAGCTSTAWVAQGTNVGGTSVWGSGGNDVYVLPYHSTGGDVWTSQTIVLAGTQGLSCIWGSGSGDVYAVGGDPSTAAGDGTIFHSTGDGVWTVQTNGTKGSGHLWGIWGSGSSDV
jgi:hypothetical protein